MTEKKLIIGCVHLLPTLGAPLYRGSIKEIYNNAINEAKILEFYGVDAIIIENFRDRPFYPNRVPAETIATIAGIGRDIRKAVSIPIGIAVLRNDAESALAIATAIEASFIRINVHIGTVLTPQGIIQGTSHMTTRLKANLGSEVELWTDVQVKHSDSFTKRSIKQDIQDINGLSDAVIISGEATGKRTELTEVKEAKKYAKAPVYIGSGVTLDNLEEYYMYCDGIIVGSYFKKNGDANNSIDETRVGKFMKKVECMRKKD